jgi:hypothetical protein
MATLNTADRFTKKGAHRYTENGERRIHRMELLCEVTSVNAVGFSWRTVEVLSEDERPTTFDAFVPVGGDTAWFGWEAALGRGDVQKVG